MYRYTIADVFTDVPLQGNQVAVFTDATGLSTEVMQRTAREMNLSETVFVLRKEDPNAHLRVRIFTPAIELPFAGHPILGTAFVVGRAMGSNVVRLETGAGVVPVTLTRPDGG
ncbi:MAG: PhzF family phenazine biosynthesis protein, partial [Solirubrobacterales bacterium]|nr:PhzF family phenazine biosynthesis protein [Solirubrobacterales bacterium]